ncbi:MAG: CBS domain-containing protein [bacterium]|nr:CBS domain-containing protein [bacterium]
MQVITTHINSDFDSLASMVAAQKLYPEAKLVFPGSMEMNVRLFLKMPVVQIPHLKTRDIRLEEIDLLILVDTRLADRIGEFAKIVGRPGLKIHIYDHHPSQEGDIRGEVEVVKAYGSTTTIFVDILRQQGIRLSPQEATLLALGIYEDTGFLTFASTTEEDILAVAYLRSCGADLTVISDLIDRDLTQEQISLLNTLLQSIERYLISGTEVVIASASIEHYVGDIAILAHKIRDLENVDVLFVLVQTDNRVYMVARSRIAGVDVGDLTRAFGGGGHHYAASATIRDQTLVQVKETLIGLLHQRVRPAIVARDIMSSPVKTVSETMTIQQGRQAFDRYNVGTLPVLNQAGDLVGLISDQTINKAIRHGMEKSMIREFMQTDFLTACEETGIDQIREYMIEGNQRFIPVMQHGHLVGAITKSDLLRAMHDHLLHLTTINHQLHSPASEHPHPRNLSRLLREQLPQRILSILQTAGQAADELGVSAYVVGGFVRDLLLRVSNFDIDLVIEGNGILFAEYLANMVHGRLRAHQRFGTAVVIFPDGFKIDVATARIEYYERPVALPNVELSSLKHDLYRRDFTINTLAIQLNREKFGYLIDFFGGQKDLKEKKIQVLHSLSFIEDPTRIFRAIRFEQRYGFKIGKNTLGLLTSTIKRDLLTRLKGYRLFTELCLILQEEEPIRAVIRMEELNVLKFIHPQIRVDEHIRRLFNEIKRVSDWYQLLYLEPAVKTWLLYFVGLADQLTVAEFTDMCRKLEVSQKYYPLILRVKIKHQSVVRNLLALSQPKPSQIYQLLSPFSLEVLLYAMAKSPAEEVKKMISLYLRSLRSTKVSLTGRDLQSLGYQPGPTFKKILDNLLQAKLDGEVKTRQDEIAYVKQCFPDQTSDNKTGHKAGS